MNPDVYKAMKGFESFLIFSNYEYRDKFQLQGKVVIIRNNTQIASIMGKEGEKLGEHMWIGRISEKERSLVVAVSRKDPRDV